MAGSFDIFKMMERLERNNFVHPIETVYHCKQEWHDDFIWPRELELRYWPRDYKDLRANGFEINRPMLDRRMNRIGTYTYRLNTISFTINNELELWLPVSAPNWADNWEIMDTKGGKLQPDGQGGMVPSTPGQIMSNRTARSISRVYRTLIEQYSEWIKP